MFHFFASWDLKQKFQTGCEINVIKSSLYIPGIGYRTHLISDGVTAGKRYDTVSYIKAKGCPGIKKIIHTNPQMITKRMVHFVRDIETQFLPFALSFQ
jgi:hypothetical protein